MKQIGRFVGRTAFGFAITLSAFMQLYGQRAPVGVGAARPGSSPGDSSVAASRDAWELLRLRDPATGRIPEGIRERELTFAATLPTSDRAPGAAAKSVAGSGFEWVRRGPYNVAGRTRALAVDADHPSTLLAGGVGGGMWRSVDGGASWSRTTLATQHPSVTCVVQDVRAGRRHIWYYGTGERNPSAAEVELDGYHGDGIFKSTDGGSSWRQIPSTASASPQISGGAFDYVGRLAIDPSGYEWNEVYAAASGGIMRSTDGGDHWSRVLGGATSPPFADVAVTNRGVVYAALGGDSSSAAGIWRSADGVAWTKISPPAWPASARGIVIGISPANPDIVYVLAETPGAGRKVSYTTDADWHSLWRYQYRSGDGAGSGGVWEDRSANIPGLAGVFGGFRSRRSYALAIGVAPGDENLVVIGGGNLYRSTDGFATGGNTAWIGGYQASGEAYPNHHPDQHAIAFAASEPRALYSANDGGVQRTDDMLAPTVGWISLDNGYGTAQFWSVAINPTLRGDNTIMGGIQGNGVWRTRSRSQTEPWTSVTGGDGGYCAVADVGDGRDVCYSAVQGGGIYRKEFDAGGGVIDLTRVDPFNARTTFYASPFALDPSDNDVMYLATGHELWRNSDLSRIPPSLDPTPLNWDVIGTCDGAFSAIGISHLLPAHQIYLGSIYGAVMKFNGKYGPESINGGNLPFDSYVSCMAVDQFNGDHVIAVYSNYSVISLFETTTGGYNWTPVSGNLEEHPDGSGSGPSCRWVEILHRPDGNIYFVGTSTGLYSTRTLKGEATVWTQEGAGTIGNVIVEMIRSRQSDGTVVVATHGNGVFSASLGASGVDPARGELPARARLDPPAPDPAREGATIGYAVAGPGTRRVHLGIFDLGGREVATLVDRPLGAGEYAATLAAGPAAALPSGRYLCRLSIDGRVEAARAMTIVR